jgi:hypothetical protein
MVKFSEPNFEFLSTQQLHSVCSYISVHMCSVHLWLLQFIRNIHVNAHDIVLHISYYRRHRVCFHFRNKLNWCLIKHLLQIYIFAKLTNCEFEANANPTYICMVCFTIITMHACMNLCEIESGNLVICSQAWVPTSMISDACSKSHAFSPMYPAGCLKIWGKLGVWGKLVESTSSCFSLAWKGAFGTGQKDWITYRW